METYMKYLILSACILFASASALQAQINTSADTPLRVIAMFAHPDDADSKMGATAAMMAEMGHEVKFLSLTNGNAGHQEKGGGALARIRRAEAEEAGRRDRKSTRLNSSHVAI